MEKVSKGTFSCTQIAQLLSKLENMAENWVNVNFREYGASNGPPAPIFRPNFWSNEFSVLWFFFTKKLILPYKILAYGLNMASIIRAKIFIYTPR